MYSPFHYLLVKSIEIFQQYFNKSSQLKTFLQFFLHFHSSGYWMNFNMKLLPSGSDILNGIYIKFIYWVYYINFLTTGNKTFFIVLL